MSFYEIESGLSALLQGSDRRREDIAARMRLKSKLEELRAAGMLLELPSDDEPFGDEVLDQPPVNRLA